MTWQSCCLLGVSGVLLLTTWMVKTYEWNHLELSLPEASNNVLCPTTKKVSTLNIVTLLVRNYLRNCFVLFFPLQGLAKALLCNRNTFEERLEKNNCSYSCKVKGGGFWGRDCHVVHEKRRAALSKTMNQLGKICGTCEVKGSVTMDFGAYTNHLLI